MLLAATLMACGNAEAASRYYVDFAKGDDSNSGARPEQAWKHAPGDPAATGNPAARALKPGDHVIFAAGAAYRGQVRIKYHGTRQAPIVFEGAAGAPAVIDGSDPVRFVRCRDAAMCGGLANWRQLVLVDLPSPAPLQFRLFADHGYMRLARSPDPSDDFYADEISDMLPAEPAALAAGRVAAPAGVRGLTEGYPARIAVWVQPNVVEERAVRAITDGIVTFDNAALNYYPDRPARYALIGLPEMLDRPGEYVVLPGRKQAVAMLPPGASSLSIASGRGGIRLLGASHIVIRNLTFRRMFDGDRWDGGIAILGNDRASRGIRITGNRFADMELPKGNGPITLNGIGDLAISDNRIERIVGGSGMRIGGPSRNVTISGNRIERIGRTGIMLIKGVEDALVTGNLIDDVRGVHGNGMSAYLGNRRIRFFRNTVLRAKQPVTFYDAAAPRASLESSDIEFRENLLVGTPDALGALIAWGENTSDVLIVHNVLLGAQTGLRVQPGNRRFTVQGNVGVAPQKWPTAPRDWSVLGNSWIDRKADWASRLTTLASGTARAEATIDCTPLFGAEHVERIGANIVCE